MPTDVIYARKSTESEDRQVLSIDSQVQELRALAKQRGVAISEVLTETKSAKAPGRPVFGQLMRRVHNGRVRSILCWKMDRLARNHLDTGAILQALADGQLEQVVTSDRTYTRDGNDRFMGNFELGMATKYIDDLRANVKRGNRARFARGWLNHNPPLGYLLDPVSKTIVKDPERFDLVRRMFDLVLTRAMRPTEVLRTANAKWGFRTRRYKRMGGCPMARSTLFKMLGDPFYTGIIRLRTGETYPGAHPAMLTYEEFQRLQEILGRPDRPRPQRHAFAFTGILKCGYCGASVTAEEHVKRNGKRYVYSRCTRRKRGVVCAEPAVSEPNLEAQFGDKFKRLAVPERVKAWMIGQAERHLRLEAHQRESARETITKALDAVKREAENLVSLRLRDLLTDEVFVVRKKGIDSRQRDLEMKLNGPVRGPEEVKSMTIATIDFATRLADVFSAGTQVQKRMILETVGLNYTVQARKVAFSFRNPFSMLAQAGANSNWWTCPDDVRTWLQDTTEYFALPAVEANANEPITVISQTHDPTSAPRGGEDVTVRIGHST
jgi:DNA invertase Pin-like site-specific DNA recombinase